MRIAAAFTGISFASPEVFESQRRKNSVKNPLKTALVTGGAKRIGQAIVEDLAAHGFAVAIHANTSLEEAEELAAVIRDKGGRAAAVQADLNDTRDTVQLMARATAAVGPIGLLVNNASSFEKDSL